MNSLRNISTQLIFGEVTKISKYIRKNQIKFNAVRKDFSTMHPQIPRPLIFCGPSGSGKSTLVKRLMDDFPDRFGFTVSHTTRSPRPGEIHGKHYYFTDENAMKEAIENGEFIEHALFSGNMYGTSFKAVKDITQHGRVVIMDIDMQGIKQVKKTSLNPWCVFIQPPSLQDLRKRLLKRKTESEESLERRLAKAREEINFGLTTKNFDKNIVNDDLDKAYRELKTFIQEKVLAQRISTDIEDQSQIL